jgi:hypothetical protein
MERFEVFEKCQKCNGTGLYCGISERDGAAVVCYQCDGTGKNRFVHEYEEFTEREKAENVKRVYQTNPGICIGENDSGLTLEDFGGMPYQDWLDEKPFERGMEDRKHTCPRWYYQGLNLGLAGCRTKFAWCKGRLGDCFSNCVRFKDKEKCWKQFDEDENE